MPMTEKQWMRALAGGPLEEVLPALKDWLLEQSTPKGDAKASFCEWLLWRNEYTRVTPQPADAKGVPSPAEAIYWYACDTPEDLANQRVGDELPAPLFRHGIRASGLFRSRTSNDYRAVWQAWETAFKAWAHAYLAGELEEWLLDLQEVSR